MEKRILKVSFSKTGNGMGARIPLSIPLLKKMGITQEEREVEVMYDEERQQVIIQKKK
ncbi:hypothetical protein FSBG_00153 [Fusobacterium gonidiaformans 3-1-5R]|uniref:SpoVT-AbrB domain-containing protein n=1 Tax=Fusobacterium gonidiaformans 3-1-5R TaxID=469605 RepID=E5BEX5_9FUSO|nr:hypothetical protein [Fusobacterium gonidiaformans]EFS20656.1 hypothetical protein FSBG_00153 [Fusobacterium gonidiaformans 3-1-5R]